MSENPQLPVPKSSRPPEVFLGPVHRGAALLIDFVVIYFAGYTLEMALRHPLMRLGPGLSLLSYALVFAYFWLGNGPVGGGATLGKAVLNMHVVGFRGGRPVIPGYGESFRRTLLQFPLIYLGIFQFVRDTTGMPPREGTLIGATIGIPIVSLLITYGYSLLTHPQKATWYDLWTGLRVTPDPTPSEFAGKLAELSSGTVARRASIHRTFSRYFFICVCLVFGLTLAPILKSPYYVANLHLIGKIQDNTPLEGYQLQGVGYRAGRDFTHWKEYTLPSYVPVNPYGNRKPATPADGAGTTATLSAVTPRAASPVPSLAGVKPLPKSVDTAATMGLLVQAEDRFTTAGGPSPVLFLEWVRRFGSAGPDDVPEIRGQLEALRSRAAEYGADRDALDLDPAAPPPRRIVCVLTDRFNFVIFSPGKGLLGIVEGPIDPSEGPLTHAWYEPAP